jgi:hypothetical protein
VVARYEKPLLGLGGLQTGEVKKREEKVNFEPMLDYKYLNIASRATPIGSAEHVPDRG